jgi:hypothetical protein
MVASLTRGERREGKKEKRARAVTHNLYCIFIQLKRLLGYIEIQRFGYE